MKRALTTLAAVAALACLWAPQASASFHLEDFDVSFIEADGGAALGAGTHPFAMVTSFGLSHTGEGPEAIADGKLRDFLLHAPRGFIADTTAVTPCETVDFVSGECPDSSVVGIQSASVKNVDFFTDVGPIYALAPPPGAALRIGWRIEGVPIVIDAGIEEAPSYAQILTEAPAYTAFAGVRNVNQTVSVFTTLAELWGVPGAASHDELRGECAFDGEVVERRRIVLKEGASKACPAGGGTPRPLLTLPRACEGPLSMSYEASAWNGEADSGSLLTHDQASPPAPQGFAGCGSLRFEPDTSSKPTAADAETGSGLDFSIDFADEGLMSATGTAGSEMKEVRVTLPEGVTVNPSVAEGLGVCTPAELDRETLGSAPGEGCPCASKLGTVAVTTPLLREEVKGSVYLARQDDPTTPTHGAENPFDSLIAFYIVLKDPRDGILVKQPAKVQPDPATGQLVTVSTNVPQVPIGRFTFHFREGQRAPLITPPRCGTFTTLAEFTPWARPGEVVSSESSFQITHGVGGGPCPPAGAPPFAPGFEAGSLNNAAKAHSPFYMRLTRKDGEQEMTKFSSVLPPGVVGSLAGLSRCPDAAIAAAPAKSARQELASPSCPESSKIGRTVAGAGVGSELTYVPGSLYLAGPYHGDPLSVVSITPAEAGPFDAGTVVVRIALTINPKTAEVEADGAASDPIPHILKGIPLNVRDLRVYADRPNFILNPTSCEEEQARATLFGSNLNLIDPADDVAVDLRARYQAAGCARLPFRPKLSLRLKGGTRRGAFPALRAVFSPRPQDANLKRLALAFPRSEFVEQGHFRTICTRVQFAAGPGFGARCPKGSVYGHVKVLTPLLDEPLTGPVYLRSSNHNLPDAVLALHGIVDLEVSVRIDSIHGRLRATVPGAPDAPVTRAIVRMGGGQKGLFVNSTNLCRAKHRATARTAGQNGRRRTLRPLLRPRCPHRHRHKRHRHRG